MSTGIFAVFLLSCVLCAQATVVSHFVGGPFMVSRQGWNLEREVGFRNSPSVLVANSYSLSLVSPSQTPFVPVEQPAFIIAEDFSSCTFPSSVFTAYTGIEPTGQVSVVDDGSFNCVLNLTDDAFIATNQEIRVTDGIMITGRYMMRAVDSSFSVLTRSTNGYPPLCGVGRVFGNDSDALGVVVYGEGFCFTTLATENHGSDPMMTFVWIDFFVADNGVEYLSGARIPGNDWTLKYKAVGGGVANFIEFGGNDVFVDDIHITNYTAPSFSPPMTGTGSVAATMTDTPSATAPPPTGSAPPSPTTTFVPPSPTPTNTSGASTSPSASRLVSPAPSSASSSVAASVAPSLPAASSAAPQPTLDGLAGLTGLDYIRADLGPITALTPHGVTVVALSVGLGCPVLLLLIITICLARKLCKRKAVDPKEKDDEEFRSGDDIRSDSRDRFSGEDDVADDEAQLVDEPEDEPVEEADIVPEDPAPAGAGGAALPEYEYEYYSDDQPPAAAPKKAAPAAAAKQPRAAARGRGRRR